MIQYLSDLGNAARPQCDIYVFLKKMQNPKFHGRVAMVEPNRPKCLVGHESFMSDQGKNRAGDHLSYSDDVIWRLRVVS